MKLILFISIAIFTVSAERAYAVELLPEVSFPDTPLLKAFLEQPLPVASGTIPKIGEVLGKLYHMAKRFLPSWHIARVYYAGVLNTLRNIALPVVYDPFDRLRVILSKSKDDLLDYWKNLDLVSPPQTENTPTPKP